VFAAVRGLRTWNDMQLLRKRLDATITPVTVGAATIETRVAAIENRTAELERAQARLRTSLTELSVLLAALTEARELLNRATGFIPR